MANTNTGSTTDNAMMAHAGILGIINGRIAVDVTFRAVSTFADTQIQMVTTTKSPFARVASGDQLRCKQSTAGSWTSYTIASAGCQVFNGTTLRVTTWTQGCAYVAPTSGNTPCGDAQSFSGPSVNANQEYMQYIDGGYTASPTRPGIWYIR